MITLDQCIAGAKQDLNIETTNYDTKFRLWANDCVRQFNSIEVFIKKSQDFPIDDKGRVCLPKGFYRILLARANPKGVNISDNDSDDINPIDPLNPLRPQFSFMYYLDIPFLSGLGCNDFWSNCNCGSYQINGDYMQLFGDWDSFSSVSLCYMSYNVNDKGQFNATEDMELAIRFYLCYWYAFTHSKEFAQWQVREYKEWWLAKFNQVNGRSHMRYFDNVRPQMMSIMNTLIANKNIYFS
jgi:hypothetical protein